MAISYDELIKQEKHLPEAILADKVVRLIEQKISTFSVTTVKAIARGIGFSFSKKDPSFGSHHSTFGRVIGYIQAYDLLHSFPDRTRIIFTEAGEVSCSNRRTITGIELMEIFRFPWKDYPAPSITGLEKAYAFQHPCSQAARKHLNK